MTTLRVYNVIGEVVAVLVNEELLPGKHNVIFDAGTAGNLSSGIYIYVLNAGTKSFVSKMMLVK
jgi:hypothetical protein